MRCGVDEQAFKPKPLGLICRCAPQSNQILQIAPNFASMKDYKAHPRHLTSPTMPNSAFIPQRSSGLLRLCLCLCIALLASACTNHTSVSSKWVDTKQRNSQFERVLVVAVSANTDGRMSFEDAVVYDLRGPETQAWPSSRLMKPDLEITRETLRPIIEQQQADAIVVTRVTRLEVEPVEIGGRSNVLAEQQQSGQDYVYQRQQGTLFRYDYKEDVEKTYISSEYTTELTTDVYAAGSDERIYTIVSRATKQESLADVIDVLSDVIAKRLRRDKVIK
jgi:hypothetical protein